MAINTRVFRPSHNPTFGFIPPSIYFGRKANPITEKQDKIVEALLQTFPVANIEELKRFGMVGFDMSAQGLVLEWDEASRPNLVLSERQLHALSRTPFVIEYVPSDHALDLTA